MHKITILLIFLFFLPHQSAASFECDSFAVTTIPYQQSSGVFYKNNTLYIKGLVGSGNIEIFSIIGNKISQHRVSDLSAAQIAVSLDIGNMYIVRVTYQGNVVKTFKILAS